MIAKAEPESPSERIQERAASNGHASSRHKGEDEIVFALDTGTPPSRSKQHEESAALFANIPFSASLILGPGQLSPP